ncbi:hypothetical protein Slala03_75410 [Streptomyces lavendulae subsp. lavendulae]|nr:hypothetical protein Slala03_75410 [Streptomyces lavendulae subsp. lavendulae]
MPNPQQRIHQGRAVVNRDWMAQHTGASRPTVNLWYTKRHAQPPEARHPEKAVTIDRVDYYDREEFEAFHARWQERKHHRVLPTGAALYEGDIADLVSINDATRWFHFAGPGVIRKYLTANPDYFPRPAGTLPGTSGRQVPAFRRADLQAFDQNRTGDNTGTSGRKPGTAQRREPTAETETRVTHAIAYLRDAGGYHRGAGAALAAQHDEPAWKWERAVKEARARLDTEHTDS